MFVFVIGVSLEKQRALKDLWRTMLSPRRIQYIGSSPLSTSPVTKLDRRHTGKLRNNLLTGEGGWEEPNRRTTRESLYKLFTMLSVIEMN